MSTPSWDSIFLSLGRLSWSGVDLFLVLSGFLIGGILLDAKDSPRYFTTFYLRRAYRILPIYGVVVGIYSLRYLPVSVLHSWAGSAAIPFGAYPTFTQNFWMASRGTFGPVSMAVTWSLAVEEQFYLTAPLIVRRLSRKRLVYMLAAIVFLAPILRVLLVFTFHQDCLAAYVLMPCRADALCLGMLSAILVRDASRTAVSVRPETSPTGRDFLLCVPSPFALIEACRFILVILFQRLGIQFRHAGGIVLLLGALLGITLTLVLAQLSWRLLEQPMLRRGHQYKY